MGSPQGTHKNDPYQVSPGSCFTEPEMDVNNIMVDSLQLHHRHNNSCVLENLDYPMSYDVSISYGAVYLEFSHYE